MLTLDHVTKRYGALTALTDVSLQIKRGEFFWPPRTERRRQINADVARRRPADPDTGTLTLMVSRLPRQTPPGRLALGLVPQHIALYQELSPDQNLRIFGQLYGLRGALLTRPRGGGVGRRSAH